MAVDTDASPSSCRRMPAHAAADAAIIGSTCPCERLGQGEQGIGDLVKPRSSDQPPLSQGSAWCLGPNTHSGLSRAAPLRPLTSFRGDIRNIPTQPDPGHPANNGPTGLLALQGVQERGCCGRPGGALRRCGGTSGAIFDKTDVRLLDCGKIDARQTSIRSRRLLDRGTPQSHPSSPTSATRSQG